MTLVKGSKERMADQKTLEEIIKMVRGRSLIAEESKLHTKPLFVHDFLDTREFWEGYVRALRSLLEELEELA
jgi:hypothetical protein